MSLLWVVSFFFLCTNTNLNQATIFHTNYLSNFSKQVRHGQNTRVIQLWLKMFRAVLHWYSYHIIFQTSLFDFAQIGNTILKVWLFIVFLDPSKNSGIMLKEPDLGAQAWNCITFTLARILMDPKFFSLFFVKFFYKILS